EFATQTEGGRLPDLDQDRTRKAAVFEFMSLLQNLHNLGGHPTLLDKFPNIHYNMDDFIKNPNSLVHTINPVEWQKVAKGIYHDIDTVESALGGALTAEEGQLADEKGRLMDEKGKD
ncbi:hypothetical protein H0H87_003765, partial [Tephrocybe sp. NHM501043]